MFNEGDRVWAVFPLGTRNGERHEGTVIRVNPSGMITCKFDSHRHPRQHVSKYLLNHVLPQPIVQSILAGMSNETLASYYHDLEIEGTPEAVELMHAVVGFKNKHRTVQDSQEFYKLLWEQREKRS